MISELKENWKSFFNILLSYWLFFVQEQWTNISTKKKRWTIDNISTYWSRCHLIEDGTRWRTKHDWTSRSSDRLKFDRSVRFAINRKPRSKTIRNEERRKLDRGVRLTGWKMAPRYHNNCTSLFHRNVTYQDRCQVFYGCLLRLAWTRDA